MAELRNPRKGLFGFSRQNLPAQVHFSIAPQGIRRNGNWFELLTGFPLGIKPGGYLTCTTWWNGVFGPFRNGTPAGRTGSRNQQWLFSGIFKNKSIFYYFSLQNLPKSIYGIPKSYFCSLAWRQLFIGRLRVTDEFHGIKISGKWNLFHLLFLPFRQGRLASRKPD